MNHIRSAVGPDRIQPISPSTSIKASAMPMGCDADILRSELVMGMFFSGAAVACVVLALVHYHYENEGDRGQKFANVVGIIFMLCIVCIGVFHSDSSSSIYD